jgi:NAD(P)-dependent dehydrogenase (short-subunit alcohol dehydrogenase family)
MTHAAMSAEARSSAGIGDGLLRISVGIEAVEDLAADLAAALQRARIAALEFAEFPVRVNVINADAVFGDEQVKSQLWETVGPDRRAARGLDADGLRAFYQKRSLLQVPVLPRHVGEAVVWFASQRTPTTGAVLPVDGGLPEAFPR